MYELGSQFPCVTFAQLDNPCAEEQVATRFHHQSVVALKMRMLHSFNRLLRSFLVIGLLASVLTSAYLDSFLRGLQSNLLRRSIPASLATAPQGAVGYYQPPPGPVVNYPYQLQTTSAPSATTTGRADLPTEETSKQGSSGTNG